ncbi:probable NOT transcription complex subunit VIP2 isoform X3 [Chenopodium quinoa]|uniref:probable NOT transcription complex subunit VIP2 isoform X3 n=1 Tax=Chenopodium quinoa TaxID=63459 RepID=UPI000B7785A5|nr:probable NOT transcription complex subunit VIP2 isoform X3 [Chenopodium quinoa]
MHGGFNVPNMSGTLSSRNSSMNSVASGGVQQPTGNVPGGRFASNNIPVALSQMSHGSSHGGYSGVTNRGGMNVVGSPGYSSNTNGVGGSIPGILPTSAAIGNRNAVPGLGVSPVLGNAGPRVTGSVGSMVGSGNIGRSIGSGGGLSVPGLASRLNLSANSGSGSLGVQGPNRLTGGVLQQGGNADYGMEFQQKEQIHENGVPMQSQHFSMGRSPGFNLGGMYSSHRSQQQQQQQHSLSSSMPPGISLRSMNTPGGISNMNSYEQQFMQQYQQHNQTQFRLQQLPSLNQTFRDQGIKPIQSPQPAPDPYGLLGLLSVIRMSDPDLTSLALGIDLTTLGLNLNSSENLHKTFASPWSDEPAKGEPEFMIPECYHEKQPPPLSQAYFAKFQLPTLFYIFYSMPRDEAQIYAANELYNRGWFYHKDLRLWFMRVPNMEPLVKTNAYERGSYVAFDPNTWDTSIKENFVIHYELVEKRPALHHQ